ncbi:hypothetical protein [Ottowia sp.]|jgi:hypothetical protein|uniref:hypothetical protein n=1 Tax=Ottowia sp. TaxID=1898956 RepID=UPI0025D8D50D|nr:hypothetical protein [Ottowia sp.]MBK6612530.1 hypothetical protein [Ottowia sp.]MBK6748316.1 hypothetical protein [Ottowia sp.]
MRRWLAILLLVLLPAQTTWAVVASYCAHQPGAAASHLGHHEDGSHGHTSPLLDGSGTPDPSSNATASASHDCEHCHGQHAAMPFRVEPLGLDFIPGSSASASDDLETASAPARPERPKWVHLA